MAATIWVSRGGVGVAVSGLGMGQLIATWMLGSKMGLSRVGVGSDVSPLTFSVSPLPFFSFLFSFFPLFFGFSIQFWSLN